MIQLPASFEARMKKLLGDEFDSFYKSYDEPRMYGLRVNTGKITCEEFERIAPFKIKKVPWIKNGYYYDGDKVQPAKHPYYHAGLYYLQEPSAMTPADRLLVSPGEAVLDLCAAPGGKATELGVKLCGRGVLVANDISSSRAKALLKNIELFGIRNPFVVSETPVKLAAYFPGFFDKILLDAPCSGEGMFRKDASVMKNYEANGVDYYAKLQKDIIPHVIRMLKPGGMLLYSTCTFSPEEDECQIARILNEYPEMKLLDIEGYEGFDKGRPCWADNNEELKKCVRIWPHRMNGEGHFLALLKKDGDDTYSDGVYGSYTHNSVRDVSGKKKNKPALEYFYEFAKDLNWDIDERRLELQGERLYYMPERLGKLSGMRFLRNGLYLGDCLTKRFEPSQALAMAIKPGEYNNVISFTQDDIRVTRYLKGETITVSEDEAGAADKGLKLLCVDGYPLGWGKLNNGILKNKYHPGWRLM